jgi:hypothetical protein
VIEALTDLLAVAGLRWLVVARPERLLGLDWLKRSLSRVLRDERLDLVAAATGVDLRQVPELALASYDPDDALLQLVVHRRKPLEIERTFRERLTTDERRSVEDDQLVRVSGRIGRQPRVFVALGRTVVGFQYGGDVDRGPARIAQLYAAGKLRRNPPVTADPAIAPLWRELGDVLLGALLPGPFDEELAAGARGLLRAATAVVAGVSPTAQQALALVVLLGGDFSSDPSRATRLLEAAWGDLANSDLGHLLGLNRPRSSPRASFDPRRLRLDVSLDPTALFDGLAAATTDSIREIMRRTPEGTGATQGPDQ